MIKPVTCLYVHYYTAVNAPKAWLKYMLFCVGKRRKPDVNLMSKLVMVSKIVKSLKKPAHQSKETNTSINNIIKLHYKCN